MLKLRLLDMFSEVTRVQKEVLLGKDAVKIACEVTGLTTKLVSVKWTNAGGTEVSNGATGYTFNAGTLGDRSGEKIQITSLTIASAQNQLDTTYNCIVITAAADDSTTIIKPVDLLVFCEY